VGRHVQLTGRFVVAALALAPSGVFAQGGRGAAPIDLTGYWVSLIVDEWRFRVSPQKGDLPYLPINAEARKIAMAWDPDQDEKAGNQCKAYGAVGVMQRPGRLHIIWADDNTLRVETDAGTQIRNFHFGVFSQPGPSLQGVSTAQWEVVAPGRGRGAVPATPAKTGTLKVVTTNMLPGYLRKNGVPYSGNAILTEYFNRLTGTDQAYLTVTAMLEDPAYLNQPFVRTYQFKLLPDASGWDPTPCN
jgi:hypothetical protein